MAPSSLRLAQVKQDGQRKVVATIDGVSRIVAGATTVHALALAAIAAGRTLRAEVEAQGFGATFDLKAALAAGQVLAPTTPIPPM